MDEAQARAALGNYVVASPAFATALQETFLTEMVHAVRSSIAQRIKRELPESRRRQALLAEGHRDSAEGTIDPSSVEERRVKLTESVDKHTYARLEALGFSVGQKLVEKLTVDMNKPGAAALATDPSGGMSAFNASQLDIVKFVCKDVWIFVFGKQVDGLKTNHRGVFVIQDDTFRWLSRLAVGTEPRSKESVRLAKQFTFFPSGIIRGALHALGMVTIVTCELGPAGAPSCTFQIRGSKETD